MFPPCPKYAAPLKRIADSKDINVHFKHVLKRVDKDKKTVYFNDPSG